MSGFNLPPGVSVSDLPGNRPEDEAYERWADQVSMKADELGVELDDDEKMWALLEWVSGEGEGRGYAGAKYDLELAEAIDAGEV